MLLANQFWDFISVLFYTLVIILGILAFIVDMLVLWAIWEIIWHWITSWFKKKGYSYE